MVGSTRPATATGADGPANTTQLDTLKSPNRGKGGMTNAKLDDDGWGRLPR
jgi:L-asparaginase/Glu-tRNA(Gln) amidotransferase subunit D